MDFVHALIVAMLASGAVGMGVSFLIQVGKLFLPAYFPDASADNWRLGLIVLTAVGVAVSRLLGHPIDISQIEAAATTLAAFGATLYPLLVLVANWIAKATYKQVLAGVKFIGKSYTPKG